MPWTTKDVDEHKKGLTPAQKKKWVSIANGVLADCQKNGGGDCEGKAIRIANSKFSEGCEDCSEEMEMFEEEWSDEEWQKHDDFIDDFVSEDESEDEELASDEAFDQAADRKKPGGSNAGKYKKGPFCGPSGGAPKGTYPVDTKKRAKAAIAYARNAPNPSGIRSCVCRHWPSLPSCKKKSSMDKELTMKTENQKVPKAAFQLMDHSPVKFSIEGEKEKLDMVVYSGGLIKGHWWWGDLAIDLEGMSFPKKKYPVLENHDTARKIGFTGKPIVEGQLRINPDTVQFVDTPESLEFRKLSREGFPFEASMYAQPTVVQRLMEKETAEVNGMSLKGPASIWRKCVFKEASVCVFGWDSNTRSASFADDQVEITLEVQTTGESALANSKGNSSREEGVKMELSELKAKHADLVLAIREEVLAEVKPEKTTLEQTIADLRTQLQQKDATITSQEERVLKLEKSEAIRREKDRVAEADRIWTEKLEASEIPEHLYAKVKSQVGYTRFVKDEVLDVENFSKAVDAEVADWIGKGVIKTKIIGGGGLSKEPAPEGGKPEEKEDEARVASLLAMAGQPVKKS